MGQVDDESELIREHVKAGKEADQKLNAILEPAINNPDVPESQKQEARSATSACHTSPLRASHLAVIMVVDSISSMCIPSFSLHIVSPYLFTAWALSRSHNGKSLSELCISYASVAS